MTKVILLNSCDGLYGGIESFLLNIFRSMEKDKFDVTFLTCGKSTYGMFSDEIKSAGGRVEEIPIYPVTAAKQIELYHELIRYFKKVQPDVVHVNSGGLSFHLLSGYAARRAGVPKPILHSHNFIPSDGGLRKAARDILKAPLPSLGTRFLACSTGAAEWIFPRKLIDNGRVEIIPNGIDTERFAFGEDKRMKFRSELGLTDELVIGNIGRFQKQKNHRFMVQMFREVLRKEPTAKLLLAGAGELRPEIENYVRELEVDESVVFLGERKDMDAFLSAIDVFVLPSLHEGLPIAAIEAQTSGAAVFLADTITTETNVTGRAVFLPIEGADAEKIWASQMIHFDRNLNRAEQKCAVENAGYDMRSCTARMKKLYLEDQVI